MADNEKDILERRNLEWQERLVEQIEAGDKNALEAIRSIECKLDKIDDVLTGGYENRPGLLDAVRVQNDRLSTVEKMVKVNRDILKGNPRDRGDRGLVGDYSDFERFVNVANRIMWIGLTSIMTTVGKIVWDTFVFFNTP